jgi:hypothetical protein
LCGSIALATRTTIVVVEEATAEFRPVDSVRRSVLKEWLLIVSSIIIIVAVVGSIELNLTACNHGLSIVQLHEQFELKKKRKRIRWKG